MAPTMTPTRMRAWLEQAWLIQYLDRQLAAEEATWFEAYAMDRPELLRTIDADTRLRAALVAAASTRHKERSVDRGSRSSGVADASNTIYAIARRAHTVVVADDALIDSCSGPSVVANLVAARGANAFAATRFRYRSQRVPMAPAMAAALLAGVGVGVLTGQTYRARNASLVVLNPTRVVYETMRGEAALPRVELAGEDSRYVLVEMQLPREADHIELNIGDTSPTALVRSTDGVVTFLADRKTLAATPDANVSYVASGRTQVRPVVIPSRRSSK